MATGTVKFYNIDRGFGFIEIGHGQADVFVHATGIAAPAMTLQEGARVEFEMSESRKSGRPCAVNVRVIPGKAEGENVSAAAPGKIVTARASLLSGRAEVNGCGEIIESHDKRGF